MSVSEILLLHGTQGRSKKMATRGRCKRYASVYNPVTGMETKRCVAWYGTSRSSNLGGLGQTSLKATLGSVKGVLITGAIAAGGAVVTAEVYKKIGGTLKLDGWMRDLAEMATGIALGIILGKLTKKPKLAAAFAIGPVVSGGLKLFAHVMTEKELEGLGMTAFSPVNPYDSMYAPLYGANKGLGSQVAYEQIPETAYPGTIPPIPREAVASVPLM